MVRTPASSPGCGARLAGRIKRQREPYGPGIALGFGKRRHIAHGIEPPCLGGTAILAVLVVTGVVKPELADALASECLHECGIVAA